MLAVPDAVVISKIVQLNASLTSREIEEAVFIEVGNDIAYRFDELCIDFTLLNSAIKNPEIMDVLIIATHTENIQKRTEISQRAGLEVKIIDIESYAIERMSLFFPKFSYQSQLLFNKSPSLLVACGLALRDIH